MRVDELFTEPHPDLPDDYRSFKNQLMTLLRAGPVPNPNDLEVAVPLARLVHDEFERYGTDGGEELSEHDIRVAVAALSAIAVRLGISGFNPPFRDYGTFRSYWLREGARGSYQARRDLLYDLFEPLHDQLADLEAQALSSTLATPISPHARTGWAAVDTEISELRRHFLNAHSPQDYRSVGNDCAHVTEALSREAYDPSRHLRNGEQEPSVDKTKQRLGRFVEDALRGRDNATVRRLVITTIDIAQHVKHSMTPTQREAGIAADAVILLANILRRLEQEE